MLTALTLGGIVSLCFNLALGLFVYSQNRSRSINKYFAFFSISIAVWSGGSFLANAGFDGAEFSLRVLRICYMAAVFLPSFYLHFISHVLGRFERYRKLIAAAYCMSAALAAFLPTGLFIRSIRIIENDFQISQPGPAYYAFFIFMTCCTLFGLVALFLKIRQISGNEKTRLSWMFTAQIIAQIAGFEYFSAVFGWWEHVPFDDYILVGHFTLMAYAILRHHLLDIEVFVKKATIFTGLFAFSIGTIAMASAFIKPLLQNLFGWGDVLAMVPSLVVILLAFRPLEKWLQDTTQRFLFQKEVDLTFLMIRFNREIVTELEPENIIRATDNMIQVAMEPERVSIYLLDPGPDAYVSQINNQSIVAQSPIVRIAKHIKKPVYLVNHNTSEDLIREMKKEKMELIVPMVEPTKEEFLGFILLGKKKSDREYSKKDLEILDSVATSVAASLTVSKKAKKYGEALARLRLSYIASGMSHQFKNKFGNISTQLNMRKIFILEALSASGSPDELVKKYAEEMNEMLRIIDEQIQNCISGKEVANTITAMANPERHKDFLLEDVAGMLPVAVQLAGMAHDKEQDYNKVQITSDTIGVVPKSACIKIALMETFVNAIDNAYESIKLKKDQPLKSGSIQLTATYKSESDMIRIVIKDNGLGIKKEHVNAVGTPGFTTKGAERDKKSGYGMGVHMMKEFVALHDGTLHYESEYGAGASCIIDLPVRRQEKRTLQDGQKEEAVK